MQGAGVAPDGAGLLGPVHAGDAVVVPGDEPHDVVPDDLVLVVVDVVDAGDVEADAGEERLPARDRVGPDDRVDGAEVEVGVQGAAPGGHDLVAPGLGGGLEHGLGAGGREGFEKGLHGRRQAVVSGQITDESGSVRREERHGGMVGKVERQCRGDEEKKRDIQFITRNPKCITSRRWCILHTEEAKVGRTFFKETYNPRTQRCEYVVDIDKGKKGGGRSVQRREKKGGEMGEGRGGNIQSLCHSRPRSLGSD